MGFYDGRDENWELDNGFKIHVVINEADFPKANIILAHGMGETLKRYDQATAELLKAGYNVIRYDQPGHGLTDGEPGYLSNAQILTTVCERVVKQVKKDYFNFASFLLGHSMGGFTVLQTIAQLPGMVDGAIVTDPYSLWLRQHLDQIQDPLLLLHGNEDGLVSVADSWDVFQGINSRDKEFHVYPFLMHSIMNDPARKADIFQEIDHWVERHRY